MSDEINDEQAVTRSKVRGRIGVDGAELDPAWPRMRNLLIIAGDGVGVAILITVLAIIGSHGSALDFHGRRDRPLAAHSDTASARVSSGDSSVPPAGQPG